MGLVLSNHKTYYRYRVLKVENGIFIISGTFFALTHTTEPSSLWENHTMPVKQVRCNRSTVNNHKIQFLWDRFLSISSHGKGRVPMGCVCFRSGVLNVESTDPQGVRGWFQGVRDLAWEKITSLFSLTSNWKLSFPSIMNVDNKPQQY
jgi:hypothetical protein